MVEYYIFLHDTIYNADLNACNKNGITPLYSAAHRGHYDIVETLLAHNASIQPPHLATRSIVRSRSQLSEL